MHTRPSLLTGALLALCAAMPLLAGCEDARESLASAIKPAGAAEIATSMRQKIVQGKFSEASLEGASFLKDKQDVAGVVAWETAKASAQAGKSDDAIRYAELALKGGTVAGVDLMSEPLLEPVRTDIRFVALAAGGAEAPQPQPQAAAPAAIPASADASIDASGIKASAGGADGAEREQRRQQEGLFHVV